MLLLRLHEIGCVAEAEFAPAGDEVGLVPSGGPGRADQHSLEWADHGMSVEGEVWCCRGAQGFVELHTGMIREGGPA
jgi:hypothetical protein